MAPTGVTRGPLVNNAINDLHNCYEALKGTPAPLLTDDQKKSLAFHRAATEPTGSQLRVRQWIDNAERLEAFVREYSRMPRENSRNRMSKTPLERSLADWVRYQRRIEENLCSYQARRLEAIPSFSWDGSKPQSVS